MENTFKSSVFGGFNRDDVIRYIEKTALENKQQLDALEQENDALCRESADLRSELSETAKARDELSSSYSAALEMQVSLKKELQEARDALAELQSRLDEREAQLSALKKENEQHLSDLEGAHAERLVAAERERKRLQAELEALRPQAEEFARVKSHIAGIELSARERADALERATRAQLSALIESCGKQCEQTLSTLSEACATVSGELRRADTAISQLPGAFESLRDDLAELQKLEKED